MTVSRDTVTPLVMGAFLLMAVTGLLLFFEIPQPLNRVAHEWLGWALVLAVAGHVTANFAAFRRHLSGTRGRVIVGAFALVLLASFAPVPRRAPPWAAPVQALADAPLATVALAAGTTEDVVRQRLAAAHVTLPPGAATIGAAVGPDLRARLRAVSVALGQPAGDDD